MKGTSTKLPCDCWLPPECQFSKSETGCKFGAECSFPHWKVEPNTGPKKGGDKSAVAVVKRVRQLGCVSQDAEPPESATISRKGTKGLGPIRRVRFTRAALCQANIRESKGPSLNIIQVKSSHRRSPYVKFEDRSQDGTERQERCAREDAWKLAKNIYKLKKRKKLHPIRLAMSGFAGRIHNKAEGKRACGGIRRKHAYGQQERP